MNTKNKSFKNKIIFSIVIGVVVLFLVSAALYVAQNSCYSFDFDIDEGWDIYIDNNLEYSNADFADVKLGKRPKGTVIDLKRTLDERFDGGKSICIPLYLSAVDAYVDGQQVYTYGHDLLDKNAMVDSRFHFIAFPKAAAGKELDIRVIFCENNSFNGFETASVSDTNTIRTSFAETTVCSAVIGVFLAVLGILLAIVSIMEIFLMKFDKRLFSIGIFSACIGIWINLYYKTHEIFFHFFRGSTWEYFLLYLAGIAFCYMLYDMKRNVKYLSAWALGCDIVFAVFFTLSSALHFTNILHFPAVLSIFHMLVVVCLAVMIVGSLLWDRVDDTQNMIMAIALIIFMIVLVLDIIRFKLQRYCFPNSHLIAKSVIPVGALIFVILVILSYLMYIYESGMSKNEKNLLMKLAYHDILSGLFNRAKYEDEITMLEESELDYAIVAFDVNGLKAVNDNLGHDRGDALLKNFAQIFKKNFEDIGVCFRIGGDEFTAIVIGNNIEKIDEALANIKNDEIVRASDLEFNIEAAYGVAYKREKPASSVKEIIKLADERMYEMKFEQKKKNPV